MSPSEPAAGDIRRWRLRTRLALVMFFVFIPIFTLVVLTHISALKERRESRVESLKTLDQSIAASVDGFAQDLQSFAKSASITLTEASAAGFPISQENFGPYFVDLANSYNVRSIFVTDLNGKVIAGTTGNVGFDVSNRPYFATLRSGAETVWSGGLAGTLSGQTTLAYGRVVKSASGEPLVYFFVAFYPPQLSDRLPPDLPEDTNVALIDNGGVVLLSSHDLDPETPTRDVSGSPIFQQAAKGSEVVIRNKTTPVDEDKRYGAFVPIKSTGWVIGLTRPASAIDSPLQRRFRRDLAILGAAFFAGLVAMVASASRLSRPLAMLAGSAGAIARGETPAEFEYTKDSDLYQLQTAMASMGAAIAEREERLRGETRAAERMANQLARLHASRNALAALLPPAEISSIVVREAVRAIGAHTGAVFLPDFASGTFQLAGHIGYSEPVAEQLGELVMDERSPIRDAFREGEAIVFRDAGEQNKAYPQHAALKTAAGTQAVAFLPLKVQGETLGVLLLGFAQSQYFTQDDIDLMFALANQAAQALQRSQLYDQLVRSNEAKDEFLGIIAHELRTPITTIYGGARLLNDPTKKLPPESREELLEHIEIESDRMSRLIENLLLLARLEMGREPEKSPVSLERLLEHAREDFKRSFANRELRVEKKSDPGTLASDETTLGQVVFNLLSNAAKYSPDDKSIELVIENEAEDVVFRILDRGPGVRPEELGLIFESFYRSPSTARQATGKGIGLAVCRRLVESLGGRIWAQNRVGGGLEVAFSIPNAGGEESQGQQH